MAKILVRVTCTKARHSLETEDYRDAYLERCEEEGETPEASVPAEFALERFKEDLDEGEEDLAEIFESESVEVSLVG